MLDDASRRSVWVVRSQRHQPSKEALQDGGYAAARESVEVTWAAPLQGAPKGVGTFWAYFPTASGTTLSGIVNAPWKLADDRESLLAGPFNDEILTRCCRGSSATPCPACTDPIAQRCWTYFPHVARKPGTTRTTCSMNR